MKFFRIQCLLLTLFGCVASAQEPQWQLRSKNATGEAELDPATGTLTLTNGAVATYSNIILTADSIVLNEQTGEATAEGSVTIKTGEQLFTGDHVVYNFQTGEMQSLSFRTGNEPIYVSGNGLHYNKTNGAYVATNAFVTTDFYAQPAHRIRAKEVLYIPGKYFELHHARLYFGKVPVFYWPYYQRHLDRHYHVSVTPGYRSSYGAFALSTLSWSFSPQLHAAMQFDLRSRRGIAFGPSFRYDLQRWGVADFEYYFLDDSRPGTNSLGKKLSRDRDRLKFDYRVPLDTNLTFKTAVRYQSDEFIVRDFFESEYRQNVQPSTFAELIKLWPNVILDVIAQPQLNDFFETVERLPDIKLSMLRQQLGNTPLYYEGESSFGYFQRRFTYDLEPTFSAYRGETFHQLLLPHTFFGWLNVTPRAGGRFTYYSEADGAGATSDEETRGVFNTGVEATFKASRVWRNVENKLFEINELRHIIEPGVNYAFVPRPNVLPPKLPQFDYELPSLRPLPIDFPEFNSIDSIDAQNVVRLSLRNRLQTKRDPAIYAPSSYYTHETQNENSSIQDVANWNIFTDWRIDPNSGQATFNDLYSDLYLRPRGWLNINSETRFDIHDGRFLEANHYILIRPSRSWTLFLGHRYLDDLRLYSTGNNLFYESFYYKFNENWAARISHYFEARNGTLAEQYYTLYRDFRSWTGAITLRLRDNRSGEDDFAIAFTFSLKGFPRFGLGSGREGPERLVGR
jgi:LPS-assembly protein